MRIFTIVLSVVPTWVRSGAVASAGPIVEGGTDNSVTEGRPGRVAVTQVAHCGP